SRYQVAAETDGNLRQEIMKLKKSLGFSLVVALAALASCAKLREKPVVDFVMQDFKAESAPNCREDSACATFQVQYPEFLGVDTTVGKSIANRVVNHFSNAIAVDASAQPGSLQQLGNDFVKDFKDFTSEEPGYDLGWYFRGQVTVLISSDTLISLQVDSETFTGGAHANYSTNFVNIEPKNGTEFLLDQMLRPGYRDDLNRLAAEELERQLQLNQTDSLESTGFDDGTFEFNNNYGFRKEGIVFYFDVSEFGSPVDDPVEIIIPYEKLRGWMK
ncbi:MAG TPA: DUF4163 domain-containing protein, partial [Cyclobacteriaceae bacterium]